MPKYTEYLNMAVTPELKAAIAAEAERQGRTPSAMARYTLERVYLADQVTVEQCADTPSRQIAEEFVPDRTLEQCKEYAHTRGVPSGLNVVDADEVYTAACKIIRDMPADYDVEATNESA